MTARPALSPAMDARMAAVSSPAAAGTLPQAAVNHSRPDSRSTRPGRSPGASPMSSAPKTLPLRSAGRKVALGSACARTRAASATTSPDSAYDGRPSTMTTPSPSGCAGQHVPGGRQAPSPLTAEPSGCASSAVAAPASPQRARATTGASPGRSASEAVDSGGQRGRGRGQLDQGRRAHHRLAQAEEQHRQLLAQVAGQGDQHRGGGRGVDGGPGQAEDQIRREAVAELGVDRVGADDALGQLGPGVRRLVGQPGAADHGDRAGPAGILRLREAGGRRGERLAPAGGDQLAVLADLGLDEPAVFEAPRLVGLAQELPAGSAEAHHLGRRRRDHVDGLVGQRLLDRGGIHLVAVDRLEREPPLVAQPPVVDRFRVDAQQPGQAGWTRTARRPGTRPNRWCRSTPPGRGPTGGP